MIRELLPPETGIAFEVMRALRTELSDERAFVEQVDERQRPEGYRLVAAFEQGSSPAAVAGFRTGHSLGCNQLHLDSGVGIDRAEAHRLYLTSGLVIAAHHFARYIDDRATPS